MYFPTKYDWATYIGTLGFFFRFLFIRFLPMTGSSRCAPSSRGEAVKRQKNERPFNGSAHGDRGFESPAALIRQPGQASQR
jgi:hypothetical protein